MAAPDRGRDGVEVMSPVADNAGALWHEVLAKLAAIGFVSYDIVDEHRYDEGSLLQIDGSVLARGIPLLPQPLFWLARESVAGNAAVRTRQSAHAPAVAHGELAAAMPTTPQPAPANG